MIDGGADLVAIGRELLREPRWVEKVMMGDEASIRTTMSFADMEELGISGAMQTYLKESFGSVMNFTPDGKKKQKITKTKRLQWKVLKRNCKLK